MTWTSSDILQIWRCFKVWNGSFRIIALSLLLYSAEIGNIFMIPLILDDLNSRSTLYRFCGVQFYAPRKANR